MSFIRLVAIFDGISLGCDEDRRGSRVKRRHVGERVASDIAYNTEFFGNCGDNRPYFLCDRLIFSLRFLFIREKRFDIFDR